MGFMIYGGLAAQTRSTNTLKMTATTLKMIPRFEVVAIPFFALHIDEETGTFAPPNFQGEAATLMLDELLRWTEAPRPLRRRR